MFDSLDLIELISVERKCVAGFVCGAFGPVSKLLLFDLYFDIFLIELERGSSASMEALIKKEIAFLNVCPSIGYVLNQETNIAGVARCNSSKCTKL